MTWPFVAIQCFATRAERMSLSLTLRNDESDKQDSVGDLEATLDFCTSFITSNMSRVRQLEIRAYLSDGGDQFLAFWNEVKQLSVPALQKIEILAIPSITDGDALHDLFPRGASLLKSVNIQGFPIQDLNLAPFQALTSLNLRFPPSVPPLSLAQLPLMLSHTPGIVKLSLFGDPEPPEVMALSSRPTTVLPNCASLTLISFHSDQINYLLSSISFPVLKELSVDCISRLSAENIPTTCLHDSLPSAIRDHCRRARSLDYWIEDGSICIDVEYSEGSTGGDQFKLKLHEDVYTLPDDKMKLLVIQLLTRASRMLNFTPERLYFFSAEGLPEELYSKDLWMTVLAAHPSTKSIQIRGDFPVNTFIAALAEPNIVCPSLKTLLLETEERLEDEQRSAISRMRRSRQERGAKINKVRISTMHSDSDTE